MYPRTDGPCGQHRPADALPPWGPSASATTRPPPRGDDHERRCAARLRGSIVTPSHKGLPRSAAGVRPGFARTPVRAGRRAAIGQFAREWLLLELFGHVGLILLRQLCGTWWSWRTGGPFAYWDVSRAMLHGDAWWVVAVVGTSAIRGCLLAEWGRQFGWRQRFGAWAWLPWLGPGCLLGWVVLIHHDTGAAAILGLRAGVLFAGYHVLFFGYVTARLMAVAVQLLAAAHLLVRRRRRGLARGNPWPGLPLGGAAITGLVILCAAIYLHIYHQGGSYQAEWRWFARGG